MCTIDRRTLLNRMLIGAAGTAIAAASVAANLNATEAMPLTLGRSDAIKPESLVEEAQVVVVRPRRRRRWSCRWWRGRRICGWR